jgi:hypothetical protein
MISMCPPNDWLISCKRPCENLWSLVAAGRIGRGRRPAPPAFVGCTNRLGRNPPLRPAVVLSSVLEAG